MKKKAHKKFSDWLLSDIGQYIQNIEKEILNKLPIQKKLPNLIIGAPAQAKLIENLSLLLIEEQMSGPTDNIICSHFHALALRPESIEHIILPHTLDFSAHPYAVLREVNIALHAGGCVTIIGFNPFSLWGLRRLFSITGRAPWCGKFRSLWQIKSWLDLLNYEIVECKKTLYYPPILELAIFKKFKYLEPLCRFLLPFSGAIYIVMARKKVFGVTPLRPKWKKIPKVLANQVIKPVSGEVRESNAKNS